jgi:hypothetical protein
MAKPIEEIEAPGRIEPDYQVSKVRLVQHKTEAPMRDTFELWVNDVPVMTSGGVDVEFRKGQRTVVVARLIVEDLVIE